MWIRFVTCMFALVKETPWNVSYIYLYLPIQYMLHAISHSGISLVYFHSWYEYLHYLYTNYQKDKQFHWEDIYTDKWQNLFVCLKTEAPLTWATLALHWHITLNWNQGDHRIEHLPFTFGQNTQLAHRRRDIVTKPELPGIVVVYFT